MTKKVLEGFEYSDQAKHDLEEKSKLAHEIIKEIVSNDPKLRKRINKLYKKLNDISDD
jgi:hypothetical protein